MPVQNQNINKTVEYLRQLGLLTDQAGAYLYLLRHGPQTVLSLSRGLGTGRTKLYPLLDELAALQLVEIHERHYGTSYEAAAAENLEFLVNRHEQKSHSLRSDLPATLYSLKELHQTSLSTSKIIEYKGLDGFKQMRWNLGKAEKEYRIFELAGLDKQLGKHFTDKVDGLLAQKRAYKLSNRQNAPDSRYLDPKTFKIEIETYIYNNVVTLVGCAEKEITGVEIYSFPLARQQKQLFELLWNQAG